MILDRASFPESNTRNFLKKELSGNPLRMSSSRLTDQQFSKNCQTNAL